MSSYIKTLQLMDNTVAHEASEEATFAEYAEGASRVFDRLCDVDDDFFAKAGADPSTKTFYGNGIDMMQLPPFVSGTVSAITIDDEAFDSEDYRVSNSGFLIRVDDNDFDEDNVIVITARWGFVDVPRDVQLVVQKIANLMWRTKDPMFAQMSNVEMEQALSPLENDTIKKYRDKYGNSAQ
jgi:hypothetical protein